MKKLVLSKDTKEVLILVLLGCGLLGSCNSGNGDNPQPVLILVLLGCGLVDAGYNSEKHRWNKS